MQPAVLTRFGTVAPLAPLPPPAAITLDRSTERRFSRRIMVLTVVAIAVGAFAMGVSSVLGNDENLAPATYLRYALVLTLAVYAVVGLLVVTQITPSVRLRWTNGDPVLGIGLGVLVGGGLSGLLLAIVSAAAGHLDPDPRIVTLMSEGDAPHVIATVLISCAAAPLVEEVLFRGLLLESQRWHGARRALCVSAAAFAVWHLNPAALKYYALLGALLGWLYLRHGLVCSMAAHFAFNGVLTVAALSVVMSPGPRVNVAGMSLQAPNGWHRASAQSVTLEDFNASALDGPSGSGLAVLALPTPTAPDLDRMLQQMSTNGAGIGAVVDLNSVRQLQVSGQTAVELDARFHGDGAKLVIVPHAGYTYELVLHTAGSLKAQRDFDRMLASVQIG